MSPAKKGGKMVGVVMVLTTAAWRHLFSLVPIFCVRSISTNIGVLFSVSFVSFFAQKRIRFGKLHVGINFFFIFYLRVATSENQT